MSIKLKLWDRWNITKWGIYLYTKKQTFSFGWGCRWHWLPSWLAGLDGGGDLFWGWWRLSRSVWPEGDDWGIETHETRSIILTQLASQIDLPLPEDWVKLDPKVAKLTPREAGE